MFLIFFLGILFFLGFFTFFILLSGYKYFFKKNYTIKKIIVKSFLMNGAIFAGFILFFLFLDFYENPMHVTKNNIIGTYEIDKNMFDSKQAKWQNEHYKLKINNDSLFLMIYNNENLIKIFRQKIDYKNCNDNVFIAFHGNSYGCDRTITSIQFKTLMADKSKHHMLRLNSKFMRKPFSFRLILRSSKYGNMFFKRENWWFFN